ncbi:MAG: serine/threonine-protein kinase [Gemmatales bacterium]
MISAISSDVDFLKLVRKSGLLSQDVVQKFEHDNPTILKNPAAISALMLKQGLITSFQGKVLLSGKHLGFILGPYKVLEPIGKGGMGRIFLAEHMTLHRRVAIKALQSEKAKKPELLKRFYREARAAAALDHPNIVKVFDVNEGAGTHFLVMEYISGLTLRQVITAKGPLPYQIAVRYIIKTATGLKHAHEKGFIHRDIKPDNIIVSNEGHIKILDMGLARSLNEDADNLTKMLNPNAVYGSVDYISPEQSIGGKVDARSDLYSLGATLFALIAGVPPFSGTAAQILVSHQLTKVPDLSAFQPSIPPQLNAIVAKLMAKKPEKRYSNAGEVIDALLPFSQSGQPSSPAAPVVPTAEPETIKVHDVTRKTSQTSKQTKQLVASPNATKSRGFTVSPRMAVTAMVTCMGLGLITLLMLFLIKGSGETSTSQPSDRAQVSQASTAPDNSKTDPVIKSPAGKEVNESKCVILDLSKVANVISTKHIFVQEETDAFTNTIPLPKWGRCMYYGVPFDLIDPQGTTVPNTLIFGGGDTPFTKSRPTWAIVSCNTSAKVIHVLGGISGWAFPHITARNVYLVARIRYKNGNTEEHELINGVHFADWKMPHGNVPTAPVVHKIDNERHLRYFSIEPKSREEIAEIEFFKKDEKLSAAPIFFAITVEKP